MRLVTIDDVPRGSPGALLATGEIVHLGRAASPGTIEAWLPGSIAGVLRAGAQGLAAVAAIVRRCEAMEAPARERLRCAGTLLPATVRLLPPVPRPGLIVAAGLAYRSHLAEMAGTPAPANPTAFMKSPGSLSASGGTLALPRQASEQVDYEGELALVFGRRCHLVDEADAMDHIAGYTVANDLSARDWVRAVWAAQAPWEARQTWEVNIMGKQLPGFTALGPALVTADEVGAPETMRLTTTLNGRVMQDSPISDMIFPLARVVSYFSRWYAFEPGDVLLTGTPAGVGVGREPPVFVRAGDTVEVEIDRLGKLVTHVAEADA